MKFHLRGIHRRESADIALRHDSSRASASRTQAIPAHRACSERTSRRRVVALEAQRLGRGGVSFMARITELARSTIYHGLSDIRNNLATAPGRIRREGSGRKKKVLEDPTILVDLKKLVEPVTRGDPMQPLLWTSCSLRNLAKGLARKGHKFCTLRCRRAAFLSRHASS
jgi:hypothetical protein